MPSPSTPLSILSDDHPLRLTPTDVTQFVRLKQCERYLRFRLAERAGQYFMKPYGVVPQRMTPLLSVSGHTFEERVESSIGGSFRMVNYAALYAQAHNRPDNNREVVGEARNLGLGEAVVLLQPSLEVGLNGWRLRDDVYVLRLGRSEDSILHVLIADMKSTAEVKIEHCLQVAFYRLMLERIFADFEVAHGPFDLGVLFRPPTPRPRTRPRSNRSGTPPRMPSGSMTPCSKWWPTPTPTFSRPGIWFSGTTPPPAVWPKPRSMACPSASRSSATTASTTSFASSGAPSMRTSRPCPT